MNNMKINSEEILEIENLEPISMIIEKILVDSNRGSIAVLKADEKQIGYVTNGLEGTMLSFIKSKCYITPHIPTIYNIYIGTMKALGYTLTSATIESKDGDICYARLYWKHDNRKDIFSKCSFGDAVILSAMTGAELRIIRKVLDEIDAFEFPMYDEEEDE